jgi:hypothetical protein
MKVFVSFLIGFCVLVSSTAFAAAPASVPPDKMLAICGSLPRYVQLAQQTLTKGIPLEKAVSMTQAAMQKDLTGFGPEEMARYQAVIKDLFGRVYAAPDASAREQYAEINSACSLYAPGQYSQADLRNLGGCRIQALPYTGFADARDKGATLDDQLKSLKQQIDAMDKYSGPQKSELYTDLSAKLRYVYAHRELSGSRLYSAILTDCFEESKKADATGP